MPKKVDVLNLLEPAAQPIETPRRSWRGGQGEKLLGFVQKLPVIPRPGLQKTLLQSFRRQVVKALRLDDRRLPFVGADGGGEPLHALPVNGRIRQHVAGTAQGQHAVALQLAPDFHPLAGAFGGETEDEQQPRRPWA